MQFRIGDSTNIKCFAEWKCTYSGWIRSSADVWWMSWRDGASCPGSDILCSDYSNPSWGKGSHPHSHTWSGRTQFLKTTADPRLYTSHRALTERWIHPRHPRYSQRRSGTTEASKTKAEALVHGQRSVQSMSAFTYRINYVLVSKVQFRKSICIYFRPHILYLLQILIG